MKYLILAITFCLLTVNSFSQENKSLSGRKAPNFKLEDLDGNIIELKNLIGKGPIILSFWATWCKPCLEEFVEYHKIFLEFKTKEFNLIAISTDNEKSIAKVKPFIKSKGYQFPVLLDVNQEVARKYYAQSVPYSVLIDKKGNIFYSHLGYVKGDEVQMRKKIEELLSN